MEKLKVNLKKLLSKASRIAILGIGSELRGDDAAGIIAARNLREELKSHNGSPKVKIFFGGTAPENLTGELKRFKPSHLILVDSANFGKEAGYTALIKPEEIDGLSFSTHRLPTKMVVDYLLPSLNCEIIMIGIQPKSLSFGEVFSKEVEKSTNQVSTLIMEIIKDKNV